MRAVLLMAMAWEVLGTNLGHHHRVSFFLVPFCPEKILSLPTVDELCQYLKMNELGNRWGLREKEKGREAMAAAVPARRKQWGLVAPCFAHEPCSVHGPIHDCGSTGLSDLHFCLQAQENSLFKQFPMVAKGLLLAAAIFYVDIFQMALQFTKWFS